MRVISIDSKLAAVGRVELGRHELPREAKIQERLTLQNRVANQFKHGGMYCECRVNQLFYLERKCGSIRIYRANSGVRHGFLDYGEKLEYLCSS